MGEVFRCRRNDSSFYIYGSNHSSLSIARLDLAGIRLNLPYQIFEHLRHLVAHLSVVSVDACDQIGIHRTLGSKNVKHNVSFPPFAHVARRESHSSIVDM